MTAAPLPPSPDRCSHSFHPLQAAFHPDCPVLRKLAGIGAANDAASDDVKARIDAAIRRWAAKGVEFSANSCRDEFGGVSGNVIGARFNAAAKAGVIVDTGKRVPSTLPSTKGHEVRLWRGAQAARWSA
jgi:hypothetical protein